MKKLATIALHGRRILPKTPDMDQSRLVQLIRQVAQNLDRDAFSQLFDEFAPRIKALLMRRGLDSASADDLMQDAMLSVWTKAGLYDESRGTVQGWVFTIARNASIDRARRSKPDLSLDMIEWDPVDDSVNGEQRVLQNEQVSQLSVAMKGIPPEQLAVLHLAFREELTQAEIATRLGLPLGTVKSRLRLAYGRLRSAMEDTP